MQFIHDHLRAVTALLLLLTAAVCWLLVPQPSPPAAPRAVAEPWVLPTLPQRDSKRHVETTLVSNVWGVPAAAGGAAPPPPPTWSVLGIARNGAERFVLLAYEGKPAELLKKGDTLPDGARIAEIEDARFFIVTADNRKVPFGMYKNEPPKKP